MSFIALLDSNERAVVFTMGKPSGVKGPGLVVVAPLLQRLEVVELKPLVAELPGQRYEAIGGEKVVVDATVNYRVVDPLKALTEVADYREAVVEMAAARLSSVIATTPLEDLLEARETIGNEVRAEMDVYAAAWGIKVGAVQIRKVDASSYFGARGQTPNAKVGSDSTSVV